MTIRFWKMGILRIVWLTLDIADRIVYSNSYASILLRMDYSRLWTCQSLVHLWYALVIPIPYGNQLNRILEWLTQLRWQLKQCYLQESKLFVVKEEFVKMWGKSIIFFSYYFFKFREKMLFLAKISVSIRLKRIRYNWCGFS